MLPCAMSNCNRNKVDAHDSAVGGNKRPQCDTGDIRAVPKIAYAARIRFTDLQLDDACRCLCQQRKHQSPDADIWHLTSL